MTRILVTGANGHIGANTIPYLLQKGYEVVPMIRKTSDTRGLDGFDLTYQYGDVMDQDSLIAAVDGCDVILHMAAVYSMWEKNIDDIIQPALVGTKNIFEAAKQAGVSRMVYTSSMVAVGGSDDPTIVRNVDDWNETARTPYAIAKTKSEREAWRLSEIHGIPLISLNPSTVLGPYDYRITPSSNLILGMLNGDGNTWEGGINLVDVRNVAQAHAEAVEQGETGQRYLIAGHNLHTVEIGKMLKELTGISPKHIGVNKQIGIWAGKAADLVSKITKSKPLFSEGDAHDYVEKYVYCDASLANETFGLTPRGSEEILTDCLRWLMHINAFKPKIAAQLNGKFPPDPEW